jgi:hypothetical protein
VYLVNNEETGLIAAKVLKKAVFTENEWSATKNLQMYFNYYFNNLIFYLIFYYI